MTTELDHRLVAADPVDPVWLAGASGTPEAVDALAAILATPPSRRSRLRPALAIVTAAAVGLAIAFTPAASAVRGALGLEMEPASVRVAPPPPTSTAPALIPPAVRRLVGLVTDRPGNVPDDLLPGAPEPGSTRLALGGLGTAHRAIWLATTDRGAVCEIVVTGDQGGGGCLAHFPVGQPVTLTTVGSDPARYPGDSGPAYLFGLATADVTAIDVVRQDGTREPATLGASAWYWETPPGQDALAGLHLEITTRDGSTSTMPVPNPQP
jgi:hypothetical protein